MLAFKSHERKECPDVKGSSAPFASQEACCATNQAGLSNARSAYMSRRPIEELYHDAEELTSLELILVGR